MLEVMEKNYFNSTHFAWIDINLLCKKFNNSLNYIEPEIYDIINNIAENPRDKFSIEMINSWNKSSYKNLDDYFSQYRWIVACCFYTTDIETGYFILPKAIEKTEELLCLNYCQSDEIIFSFLIDEYEEHFNLYIGDYQDTLHNYHTIDSNHGYVNWVITRNMEMGNMNRVKLILTNYKEYYDKKNTAFPYIDLFNKLSLQESKVDDNDCEEVINVRYK
jgi:hypothetical protein